MAKADLTAEQLRELLNYDPETGIFTWRLVAKGRAVGSRAGTVHTAGYIQICVGPRTDRLRIYAHRLAWLFTHGIWPSEDIDHINHDKSDNRIANLRELSRSLNQQNQIHGHKGSMTGLLGVVFNKKNGKFLARIHVNGRSKQVGTFESPEEAHAAYVQAKRKLHPANTL